MIVGLLIRYWYIFAIAGLLAALGGQHWYYKNKVDGLNNDVTKLTLSIESANIREKALERSAEELTKKYKESLHNQFELQAEQGRKVAERIKRDEETKRIAISRNVVELFNSSKPTAPSEAATTTLKLYDGTASTDKKTLNELLLVSSENDLNHSRCISQVMEWQHFWQDVEQSVKALESPS